MAKKIIQSVEVIELENGNITAHVNETREGDKRPDYTWTIQNMELQTAITLVDKLTVIINEKRFG